MPAAKGNSNLSAPNPSHPRAGSSLPETALKKKNHPKGMQYSSRQIFPYQHTRTGVKQQHQSYRGRACRTHTELSCCYGGSPSPTSPCAGYDSFPSIKNKELQIPCLRAGPYHPCCKLLALAGGACISMASPTGVPCSPPGLLNRPPHEQREITLAKNNHSPQP